MKNQVIFSSNAVTILYYMAEINLVKLGKGCKPQARRALTDNKENTFFFTGQFGDTFPCALQRIWGSFCYALQFSSPR